MECPYRRSCALVPLFRMSSSIRGWQASQCGSSCEACARYRVARSGVTVPVRLLPDGRDLDLPELSAAAG